MTVSAWIESLKKFDPALDVLVRMDNDDSGDEMAASKPSFGLDIGCDDTEYLTISLTDEDQGVEDIGRVTPMEDTNAGD